MTTDAKTSPPNPNLRGCAGILIALLIVVPVEVALFMLAIGHAAAFCAVLAAVLITLVVCKKLRHK